MAVILAAMGSTDDAPTPQALDPEAPTLPAAHEQEEGDGSSLLDVDRENARSQIRARLFQIQAEPIRFGRYVLLSTLGSGGTGVVYAAYDDTLDRKVALKVLRPEITERGLGAKRLLREARAMARLSDPHIVVVHEVGEHDGQVFVTMEFIRGQNAAEWLSDRERSTTEILEVYRQAARGLVAAHEAGLIHRDFKPHNVLVGDDGVVKVVDFGLALATTPPPRLSPRPSPRPTTIESASSEELWLPNLSMTRLTRTGAIVGTPAYMSPEQYERRPVDARSDQFSFCVALYEALYGQHPFVTTSLGELMTSLCEGRVRAPPEGAVPAWVHHALLRGLSVDPADRFPSMPDLIDALARDPKTTRRRWIRRGPLVLAVFGGGFGLAHVLGSEPSDPPIPCDGGSRAIAEIWNETRRHEVEAALLGTGLPYARDTWTRTDDELQRHAQRWVQTYDDACQKHRDGEQSGELLDLRMACLERHRAALDALTAILTTTTPQTHARVTDAVLGLPSLSRCSDRARLLAEVPLPDDPQITRQIHDHRQTLARVLVKEHAGQWAEGRATAEEVAQQARALGYVPLIAEAQLRRGSTLLMEHKGAEAKAALDEAFQDALRVGHHRVATEALARRLFVEAELLGEPRLASHDIALARAMAEFVDDPGTTTLLLNNIGWVYRRLGDLHESRRALEAAIEGQRHTEGRELLAHGVPINNLALSFITEGRYADALALLQQLGIMRRELYGPSHPQLLHTQANESVVLAYLHRHRESEQLATATLRAQTRIFGEDSPKLLRTLEALQEVALRRRRYDQARQWGTRAVEIARRSAGHDSPVATGIEMLLGLTYWQQGEHRLARETIRSVIAKIREALGPDHPYLASAYWKWGRRLRSTHPQEALELLERALKIYEDRTPNTHLVGWSRLDLARVHQATGELAKAEAGMTQALAELEALLPEQSPQVADATWRLGELLQQRGALERAIPMLERAQRLHVALRDPADPDLALVEFDLLRARAEQATQQGRSRLPELDAQAAHLIDRLRDAGPGYRPELALIESWRTDPEVTRTPEPRRRGSR